MDEVIVFYEFIIGAVILTPYMIWLAVKMNNKSMVEKSKALHSFCSAFLCFVLLHVVHFLNFSWYYAFVISFFVGVGKEVYDLLHPKKRFFNFKDILYNLTGIGLMLVLFWLYELSLRRVL